MITNIAIIEKVLLFAAFLLGVALAVAAFLLEVVFLVVAAFLVVVVFLLGAAFLPVGFGQKIFYLLLNIVRKKGNFFLGS